MTERIPSVNRLMRRRKKSRPARITTSNARSSERTSSPAESHTGRLAGRRCITAGKYSPHSRRRKLTTQRKPVRPRRSPVLPRAVRYFSSSSCAVGGGGASGATFTGTGRLRAARGASGSSLPGSGGCTGGFGCQTDARGGVCAACSGEDWGGTAASSAFCGSGVWGMDFSDAAVCGGSGSTGCTGASDAFSVGADGLLPNSSRISSSVNSGIAGSAGTEVFTCSGLRCLIEIILSA